jgi:hypothetical protein
MVGLAVAVIAFASQSAQLAHRDSPIAVILFATCSILLFTLPRVGGDSHLPHIIVVLFGFTTIFGYLFGIPIMTLTQYRRYSWRMQLWFLDRETT